jgi:hypothetical protein
MKVKLTNPSRLWTPEFDLNEMIVFDWDSSKLADGPVSAWNDTIAGVSATQATSVNKPVMSAASGGVTFTGNQTLMFPTQSGPTRYFRTVVMLLKANISTASSNDGSLFAINGTGGQGMYMGYHRSSPGPSAFGQWNGDVATRCYGTWGSDSNWQLAVCRRVQGVNGFSANGNTETTSGTNVLIARNTSNITGLIGDFRGSAITWTCKRILVFQNELSNDSLARLQGWAMWSMGVQANLPSDHPYKSAQPTTKRWGNPYPLISDAQFAATVISNNWFSDNTLYKQNYGNSISSLTTGWSQDFLEDFTSISAIADETAASGGTATFFAPTIDTTGGSEVSLTTSQLPTIFTQSGSEIIYTMQKPAGVTYSSALTSINLDGRGYTFNPAKAPFYLEYKFRIGLGNAKSLWTALWMKPLSEFYNCTTGHFEFDLCETYNSEGNGQNQHITLHCWPAPRAFPGRNSIHQSGGRDMILDSAHAFPNAPISLYDNSQHTISYIVSKTITGTGSTSGFMIVALDGSELLRIPLMNNMLQPHYIIASFNQLSSEAAQASPPYTFAIDSIKVLKGSNY